MAVIRLSQAPDQLDLESHEGDPISFKFIVAADWSGTWQAQARKKNSKTADIAATLTVVAVVLDTAAAAAWVAAGIPGVLAGDTEMTISLTAAANTIPSGQVYWDLQKVGGRTYLDGVWYISPEKTILA